MNCNGMTFEEEMAADEAANEESAFAYWQLLQDWDRADACEAAYNIAE